MENTNEKYRGQNLLFMKNVFLLLFLLLFVQCNDEPLYERGLSVGIFGGSQSLSSKSQPIKDKWSVTFDVEIESCGVVGAGFGSWQENNIPNQIINNRGFDVYILWCSTNDMGQDISKDNENNPITQSGGLKRCVELIKQKNPDATILLFTSIYVPLERILIKLPAFVEKQIEFCKKYNIAYLNQFEPNVLNECDFLNDKLHLVSSDGYRKLEPRQTEFLKTHINR